MTQPSQSSAPAELSDADLLRRYEPVLRFTRGEAYFPSDIDRYVSRCSLWISHANGLDECLVPRGQLTLDKLAEQRWLEVGAVEYLKFAADPHNAAMPVRRKPATGSAMALNRSFNPGISRLARVGYLSRLADAGISLSMLVRGRVPSATAVIAEQLMNDIQAGHPRYCYYGRVVREGGWVCLNYWFFYYYDDWRSGFDGVNDHEADWENLSVVLYETADGELEPAWVVFSCHDFTGGDLRRRWDDREQLEIVGDTHPVAYVGGGSHAHYFRPGEYLIESEVTWLKRLERPARIAQRAWHKLFGDEEAVLEDNRPLFAIPFVEYARGDGMSIGPQQPQTWEQILLDPAPAWLHDFHGMWGMFVRDPVGGENAPAGPMYNRNGQPRFSWHSPLEYAGLDVVPTPAQAPAMLDARRATVLARQQELDGLIAGKLSELQTLGAGNAAVAGLSFLLPDVQAGAEQMTTLQAELRQLQRERIDNGEWLRAIDDRIQALQAGAVDDPRAHIRVMQTPLQSEALRFGTLAQIWSATSIGLLLIGAAAILMLTAGRTALAALALMLVIFLLVDSAFRRNVASNATKISMTLAVISLVLLIVTFWHPISIAVIVGIGLYLAVSNLRSLSAAVRATRKPK